MTERSSDRSTASRLAQALSFGGIVAALGASSCCVIPFLLFSLGVSGAWIADITALAPYQPAFLTLAVVCLAGGVALSRRRPAASCGAETRCAPPTANRIARLGLWTAALLILLAVAFPRLASLLLPS